jgi:hypothetical protein
LPFVTIHYKQGNREAFFTLPEIEQLRNTKFIEDVLAQQDASMLATDGEIP